MDELNSLPSVPRQIAVAFAGAFVDLLVLSAVHRAERGLLRRLRK